MRPALKLAACVVGAMVSAAPQSVAQDAVADFYRGRQVSVLVGSSPGGSASLYAQALARHMIRYLPGAPAFVVQHVPGAGGLVVANTVANASPRDGTVFAITSRTTAREPLLGNRNAKFDGRQLAWLGTANVEYTTCFAWNTAAVKTLQDAMRGELIVAGTGADATEVVRPKVANKLIGTRFTIVPSYPGSTEMLLALERGEVEGNCGLGWTFLKLRKADWLRDKKINILFQWSLHKHPDLPRCRCSSTPPARRRTARCSNSCWRRRTWAARSSRHPACRPSDFRPCVTRSRRRSRIRNSWPRLTRWASRCRWCAAKRCRRWSSASMPRRPT